MRFVKIFIFTIFIGSVVGVSLLPGTAVLAETPCPQNIVCLKNPLESIGVSSPQELVLNQFKNFVGIIALLAICFIVFNGFKLVVATNEEAITSARQGLTWAVGGFIVVLLTFTIVSSAAKFIGFDPSKVGLGNDTINSPTTSSDFTGVVSYVTINFLGILGITTVLMIIYHGFRYITSAGNEETVESSKHGLKWAILGFIVTLSAYAIIKIIQGYATS